MKKLVLSLFIASILTTIGCTKEEPMASMINPWIEVNTIEEAEKIAGFEITTPELIDTKEITYISSITNEIIDVRYGDEYVCIRKGKGNEDISGDYNEYPIHEEETIGDKSVQLKGSDDYINHVNWVDDNYSYSIYSKTGITIETARLLVSVIS